MTIYFLIFLKTRRKNEKEKSKMKLVAFCTNKMCNGRIFRIHSNRLLRVLRRMLPLRNSFRNFKNKNVYYLCRDSDTSSFLVSDPREHCLYCGGAWEPYARSDVWEVVLRK